MVLRISELKLNPSHTKKELEQEIRKILRIQGKPLDYEIIRRSVDARKKPDLWYVYTIDVTVEKPQSLLKRIHNKKVTLVDKKEYQFPSGGKTTKNPEKLRPVIVGSGPSGLFCALMLARAGLCPIILERGEAVEQRIDSVNHFWETGQLNPESNVQFGEGGAGTFSDGKLNTLIKDPEGKIRFVLKEFVHLGADEEILYHHKPHIGTDVLVHIVRNIRNEIISLGGEFRFNSCLTGICVENSNVGHLDTADSVGIQDSDEKYTVNSTRTAGRYSLSVNHVDDTLHTDHLVLAIGHSARDTFQMLYESGLPMQAKAFAVGFRIEHPQKFIDDAMYGKDCPYEMDAAPYKLTHKCENGRGVYSFCMCPGGYVVNASSEPGLTAVNGMSYSGRGSENANSAIVVTITPEDYEADHPLSGVDFQRRIEKAAYACGNGKIPVQRFEDFCENTASAEPGTIIPQCKGVYAAANLRSILPDTLNESIIEGIHAFGKKIPGFDCPDALMSGAESRTSSPVRILRDDTCQSILTGIYPCGEGAGYAGGITSAAVDGIRVAETVYKNIYEEYA